MLVMSQETRLLFNTFSSVDCGGGLTRHHSSIATAAIRATVERILFRMQVKPVSQLATTR